MDYKDLQDVGLTETEAKIYLASLELGETSVSRIARQSSIKRTTVYLSLENLMQRGLMSAIKKNSKTHYFAEDPRNLERLMEEKKQKVSNLIPQLLSFTNLIDKKPTIRYFEGTEGIKEVLNDALNYPDQEVCTWYSETYISDFSASFFSDYYVPARKAKKISVRAILPDNEFMWKLSESNEHSLRRTRFFSPEVYKVSVEIMIYGSNKLSIMAFKEKFALIIESQKIFESFRGIFETMWQFASDKPKSENISEE